MHAALTSAEGGGIFRADTRISVSVFYNEYGGSKFRHVVDFPAIVLPEREREREIHLRGGK